MLRIDAWHGHKHTDKMVGYAPSLISDNNSCAFSPQLNYLLPTQLTSLSLSLQVINIANSRNQRSQDRLKTRQSLKPWDLWHRRRVDWVTGKTCRDSDVCRKFSDEAGVFVKDGWHDDASVDWEGNDVQSTEGLCVDSVS